MVEFDRSAFIVKFQEEAQDLLQRLNEGVITLEGDPGNRELIDQMLRDAHTLKGSSRMVGLIEISDVAHRLEDIMVLVRDGGLEYTPALSDSFFEALDAIVYLADNRGVNEGDVLDLPGLQDRLSAISAAAAGEKAEASGRVHRRHADLEADSEEEVAQGRADRSPSRSRSPPTRTRSSSRSTMRTTTSGSSRSSQRPRTRPGPRSRSRATPS